ELRDVGAGQTIHQTKLYGNHVRWYAEVPCNLDHPDYFARLGVRAVTMAAAGPTTGPVHLNWPFRKPLEPQGQLNTHTPKVGKPTEQVRPLAEHEVAALAGLAQLPGLIVAGALNLNEAEAQAIVAFAETAGWPVLADAGSQLKGRSPLVLNGAETVLDRLNQLDRLNRPSLKPELEPEVLLRLGGPPSNQAVSQWVARCSGAHHLLVDPSRRFEEPSFGWTTTLASDPVALLEAATPQFVSADPKVPNWSSAWIQVTTQAWQHTESVLSAGSLLEPLLAASVLRSLPAEVALYVSNSMPVRDITSFWPPDAPPRRVLVNRGANGIDGVVSSALGAALAIDQPVAALVGDVAVLHDVGGLLAACSAGIDLTVVVPNNNGGGIFSLLPVASGDVDVHFTELFHAPHHVNLQQLAIGLGANYQLARNLDDLSKAIAQPCGVLVVEVPIDHAAGLAQRKQLAWQAD
ncbi:MAG: thiamine pyrophosphate-dependent enzyme, partial [bacterium]|nr:thiamine pyrophosphate-dependent enzyme [bacterium]